MIEPGVPDLIRLVRGILMRAVMSFYARRARAEAPRGRSGVVVYVQRFDSALRLDVHFHASRTAPRSP